MDAAANEGRIVAAWRENAAPWRDAVRAGTIASRRRVTDGAVTAAVLERAPGTVLDVGCGEGWLARALAAHGVAVTGVDGEPALVEAARRSGGGSYHVLDYDGISAGGLTATFDVVVCNFALLGQATVERLLAAVPSLLNDGGACIVQTLHPLESCGDAPYADGWREGSWVGCGDGFMTPAPWYFRTLESWRALFAASGLAQVALREPAYRDTGRPASALFIATVG